MSPIDLTTLDNLKAWLPDMANVSTSDDLLARLITAASRFVCNYTGRPTFAVASCTEDYDGAGLGFLLLRQWPVTAVESVSVQGGPAVDPSVVHLEPQPPAGGCQRLSLLSGVFPRGRSNVSVTYSSGYAATPPDVEQATIELAGERFKTRERIGQTAKTLGGQETTAFSTADMNATVTALLQPYRRVIPC